ncbi:MAG TPA: DUF427 domain-containing protein [Kofleriaceae bacterium]|nr:DUF427 domain-containing protein [Kofleriaceae bacterium]
MTLTLGTGPFGRAPGGRFTFEPPRAVIYIEEFPRRMRARFAGETVIDSVRAVLLHESGLLPVLYFPEADVRMDLLEPTERASHCPLKGDAAYYSVRVGERVARNAAWTYPEPLAGAPRLTGLVAFYWDAMEEWLEEDEPAIGHVRDPYHRVDVLDTSRHVVVSVRGQVVADTRRARVLFETGLPARWYIPRADVHPEALEASESSSVCAYKGRASYFSMRVGGEVDPDLVWYYTEPLHDAVRVADYLCFFNERVDLEIDGVLQSRPRTPWSPDAQPEREQIEMAMRWPGES